MNILSAASPLIFTCILLAAIQLYGGQACWCVSPGAIGKRSWNKFSKLHSSQVVDIYQACMRLTYEHPASSIFTDIPSHLISCHIFVWWIGKLVFSSACEWRTVMERNSPCSTPARLLIYTLLGCVQPTNIRPATIPLIFPCISIPSIQLYGGYASWCVAPRVRGEHSWNKFLQAALQLYS